MQERGADAPPRLEGETVLITGASRGLGAALALAFAQAGASVALCGRTEGALREVAEAARAAGAAVHARAVDVTDAAGVGAWVEESTRRLGPPTVLVNNASVLGRRAPLAEYPLDDWRATLDINLTGSLIAIQAVLPAMRAAARGSIINVSSGAAVLPRVDWGAYSIAKHALEGLSLNLARELEGSGIRVNIVDPGAMRTGMRAAAYPAEDPASVKRPEQAAGVFLWLAGAASRGVTGQRFRADEWR